MKKNILDILIIVMAIGFFAFPSFSLACATPPQCTAPSVVSADGCSCTYVFLAPLPCQSSNPNCNSSGQLTTFDPSSASGAQNTQLGAYLNMMIMIFIGVCAILAVIMIVIGGVEYMTSELISSKEAGKERILGAIFGLLLALGAWTILHQINPNLLNNANLTSLSSVQVNVETQPDIPQTGTVVNGVTMYTINGQQYATGAGWLQIAGQPATLPANVTVCGSQTGCGVNAQCVTVGQQGCTSTDGLNPVLVDSIANNCKNSDGTPCSVTITAGTESWAHNVGSSHAPGSGTVDLQATPALNAYLNSDAPGLSGSSAFPAGTVITDSTNGACYYAEPAGATAASTGNGHWHVYAMPASGSC
jgi:hypothetical protein